jgi:hypothetical protein
MSVLTALILKLIKFNAQILSNYVITPIRIQVVRLSYLITSLCQQWRTERGGGFGVLNPPRRNSEVLTQSNRIAN